jgi:hypothetical protein
MNETIFRANPIETDLIREGDGYDQLLTNNHSSGLFPEILRSELREVRATIEAYSKDNPLAGDCEADACGLSLQDGDRNWNCNLRVTTDVGVCTYKLDRWD